MNIADVFKVLRIDIAGFLIGDWDVVPLGENLRGQKDRASGADIDSSDCGGLPRDLLGGDCTRERARQKENTCTDRIDHLHVAAPCEGGWRTECAPKFVR